MPRIAPCSRDELAEFEPFFQAVEHSMGFLPTSMLTMGHRPEILRAFSGLMGAVLGPSPVPEDSISPQLKQLVAHITSTAAGCRSLALASQQEAAHLIGHGERVA